MFPKLFRSLFRASSFHFAASFATFLLAFSLFLAIGGLSDAAVSATLERSRPFLSADVSVSSSYPLGDADAAVFEHCRRAGAECVRRISFQSTILDSDRRPVPVRVIAAEPGYPFYGGFEVRPFPESGRPNVRSVLSGFPSSGGFLAETRVFRSFGSGAAFELFGTKFFPEGEILRSSEIGFSF